MLEDGIRYRKDTARYEVRVSRDGYRRYVGCYNTVEEARVERDAALERGIGPVSDDTGNWTAEGVMADEAIDEAEVIARAYAESERLKLLRERRNTQSVAFREPIIVLAHMADQHLGAGGTDYKRIDYEAEIVANTPGMYVIHAGDLTDNFIVPKLLSLRTRTRFSIPDELVLAKRFLRQVAPKLVAYVDGNHNHWTEELSGIDYFKEVLAAVKPHTLYDPHECKFTVKVGGYTWNYRVRHKWRGSSMYNKTHGIERARMLDGWFDVGVGAHDHSSGLIRPFTIEGKTCYAVLCGTYKFDDELPRKMGLPNANCSTTVSLMLDGRDGSVMIFEDIEQAAWALGKAREGVA
jgi:hypothetical protein